MKEFGYVGRYAYHVVSGTHRKSPLFNDPFLATSIAERLRRVASRLQFRLLAFCLMPDHVHILVLAESDSANLIRFVQRFKQETGYHFKRATGEPMWQQSFYDRALRAEEDLVVAAAYVFDNPIRAGLAAEARSYPFVGGEYWTSYAGRTELKVPSLRRHRGGASP